MASTTTSAVRSNRYVVNDYTSGRPATAEPLVSRVGHRSSSRKRQPGPVTSLEIAVGALQVCEVTTPSGGRVRDQGPEPRIMKPRARRATPRSIFATCLPVTAVSTEFDAVGLPSRTAR